MKHLLTTFLLLLSTFSQLPSMPDSKGKRRGISAHLSKKHQTTLTNAYHAGRTGDQIVNFAIGFYAAREKGYPFLLNFFGSLNQFQLGRAIPHIAANIAPRSIKKVPFYHLDDHDDQYIAVLRPEGNHSIYFDSSTGPQRAEHFENTLNLYWKNEPLAAEMRVLLQPVESITPTISTIRSRLSVGVHIRKNSPGVDPPLKSPQHFTPLQAIDYTIYTLESSWKKINDWVATHVPVQRGHADQMWPSKFPPEQYYLDAIRYLRSISELPLDIYIIAERNAQTIAQRFAQHLQDLDGIVILATPRGSGNAFMHDLVDLASADIMIRSNSRFAMMAQLMGEHKLIIRPGEFKWIERKLHVTKACCYVRDTSILTSLKQ